MAMGSPSALLRVTRTSICRRCLQRFRLLANSSRPFSSTPTHSQTAIDVDPVDRPRWQRTPPSMVAPLRTRPRPRGPAFVANDDPRKLDSFYADFLGQRSSQLQLSEEVKWQAVTHKSFDHGRRGFNDRLAFLGKRIVDLQTSQALLSAPRAGDGQAPEAQDAHGRPIFHDPALANLERLSEQSKASVVDKRRLAQLAESYGMQHVIRWKPRKANNLHGSGIESVLAQTLYAIVGALALEKGGAVANTTVRERILRPLGL